MNDYASLDQFHQIQLDTNLNGTWQAFFYDAQGRGVPVAHKYFGSNVLVNLYTSSEESYVDQPSDPFIMVRYYHFHPKYMVPGSGFQDWPNGSGAGHNNYLWVYPPPPGSPPNEACPSGTPYGAVLNLTRDPRSWFGGTGGGTCYKDPGFE